MASTSPSTAGSSASAAKVRASTPIGKDAEADLALGELHPVDLDRVAQDVGQRGGEVAEVRRRVEADEVGAEHALQQPVARMGRVRNSSSEGNGMWRKKPMRALGEPVAEEARQQEELVVVHPDHVAGPVVRRDDVGEAPRSPRRSRPSR